MFSPPTRGPGVLGAPPTPDPVYKWNNGGIIRRQEERSDSSSLLIRAAALAASHGVAGGWERKKTTKKLETAKKSLLDVPQTPERGIFSLAFHIILKLSTYNHLN